MNENRSFVSMIQQMQDMDRFREQHWEGTYEDYLRLVREDPKVTRTAFQRIYDMIMSYGTEEITRHKETLIHYKFFDDPFGGEDAIYGLEKPLMHLVQIFKSAAHRYGTERRVLLLHGPVGSSKSTIVRLLKKGLEEYSKKPEGRLYSYSWREEKNGEVFYTPCPMNEEPLHLIPAELRSQVVAEFNRGRPEEEWVHIEGDLCPFCRQMYRERSREYGGDWARIMEDIRVRRVILSEQDRVGIGTFQPKDEKNQDSTELTGDINYRKIAEYGSDSDARAFNFDGEFNIANRGLIEFIEILKLDSVTPDTLLFSSDGVVAVEDLVDPDQPEETFRSTRLRLYGPHGLRDVQYIHRSRPRDLWRITTSHGYTIAGTPEHPILVMNPDGEYTWKSLQSIGVGDFVCIQRGQNVWGPGVALDPMVARRPAPTYKTARHTAPLRSSVDMAEAARLYPETGSIHQVARSLEVSVGTLYRHGLHEWVEVSNEISLVVPPCLTPELGRLLGYLVAEGTLKTNAVSIAATDPAIIADVESLARHLGLTAHVYPYEVVLHSAELLRFLDYLGYHPTNAYDKEIPWAVLRSPREVVAEFLAGYYSGDGCVQTTGRVEATTASAKLAQQLQVVLLNFGIVAHRQKTTREVKGEPRCYWQVAFDGGNVDLFARHVRLVAPAKQARLDHCRRRAARTDKADVIPYATRLWQTVHERMKDYAAQLPRPSYQERTGLRQLLGDTDYENLMALLQGTNQTTYRMAQHLVEVCGSYIEIPAPLRQILDDHFFFDPVVSKEAEDGDTWDFTIPEGHAFFGNGFINHNTAFLYDLLGATQEHVIKPKKFAQTSIDEVIVGHSVAGETPIPYLVDGQLRFSTLAELYEAYAAQPERLQVLSVNVDTGVAEWTPVKGLHRHRFDGVMMQTSQKWGVVETTPNHSIYDRDLRPFYPEDRHEILALRKLPPWPGGMEAVRLEVPGPTDAADPPCTVLPEPGWVRLNQPRHATHLQAVYPLDDPQPLQDLLTLMVWYVAKGHVHGRNGGVVITQADPQQLERIRAAYQTLTTAQGSIDFGAKTDGGWRLYLASDIVREMLVHYCGCGAAQKRLPDFVFNLPRAYQEHVLNELIAAEGSRFMTEALRPVASEEFKERYFEYQTLSPILAAQIGTLATMLGWDYSVHVARRGDQADVYRIRSGSGEGRRGGRGQTFTSRLHCRQAEQEWVYDIECVGNHNFVCGVGNVVAHNTNEPEYRKLQNDETMEALRDRTIKVDIPYVTRLEDEIRIYEKDFNAQRIRGKHIAPHTLEMAAMWAVLTRLEEPKKAQLTLLQKLKLYNGKTLPGFTEDNIRELRMEAPREGLTGISPRYIQDKVSNALVNEENEKCVNPFMVLNELEAGLRHHSLITSEEQREHYRELLAVVREEYADIVKNEVQRAIAADEEALTRLCGNYIDNVKAYTQHEKVKNKYTGEDEEPDERLMRSIEEKIQIPESRKDDFRREIMNYIGALALDGKKFDYRSNERLQKALELKLFEDQKDTIKLTSLVSSVIDDETQEKIDVVKSRLIKNYGYCEVCAADVLQYVASIFARGDVRRWGEG